MTKCNITWHPQELGGLCIDAVASISAVAGATAETDDPIVSLIDRYSVLWPLCPGDSDEAGNIRWNAEIPSLEAAIAETMPTTKVGAVATVRFVAANLMGYADTEWLAPLLVASTDILAREA